MSNIETPDFQRERRLIEQLEFRIASADTNEKLQSILQRFLAPLLLKLASEDLQNRNLTIKVCQYINQRSKIDETIQLPVAALSKTFTESSNAFVKQFSLLFIQQGLNRLPTKDAVATLPPILQSIVTDPDQNGNKMFPVAVDFLLKCLTQWKPPQRDSIENSRLKDDYNLSNVQIEVVLKQLIAFLLFEPKSPQTYISQEIRLIFENRFKSRAVIVPNLASFLFTSLLTDEQRFIPATILSTDANPAANAKADVMFKQCNFDLESNTIVDAAFDLYEVAKPRLQTKILVLLSRSKESTFRTQKIVNLIESQLNEPASNLESSKLRAAMFSYLIWAIRVNPGIQHVADKLRGSLKDFIEAQGWPLPSSGSATDTELRARAYESIGLLSGPSTLPASQTQASSLTDGNENTFLNIVFWLFTSLRCDTTRDVRHSIEESLSRMMIGGNLRGKTELSDLKSFLLWNVMAEEGSEDPTYHLQTRNIVQYPAVRFTNKVFPFSDIEARIINLIALTSDRREVVEEGQRGLDPNWHAANSRIGEVRAGQEVIMPSFDAFASVLFAEDAQAIHVESLLTKTQAIAGTVGFLRNLLALQAWEGTAYDIKDNTDWSDKIDAALDNEGAARTLLAGLLARISASHVVKLLALCYKGMSAGSTECGRIGFQLTSLASDSTIRRLHEDSISYLEKASNVIAGRYLACRTLGIVVSLTQKWPTKVRGSLQTCENWRGVAGHELVKLEVCLLQSACILSRVALRNMLNLNSEGDLIDSCWKICNNILEAATDKGLKQTALIAIGQLTLCVSQYEFKEADKTFQYMLADAKKENEASISAFGRLLFRVWPHLEVDKKKALFAKIYELHEVRKAEIHFALGEAMAVAALGFSSTSTLTELDVNTEMSTHTNTDLYEQLLDDVLEKSKTTKPALKKANGIWLLSLVQFCSLPDLAKPHLREIQAAFSRLLTDRDEIVQETGSRGLGIVYEKGDQNLRDDLVRDLVQSFTGSTAKISGTVTEDTQLFEPGALPTENGQSVTTYRDIVSLAQEMGDPSLVYRFMNLASNNAIWTSRAAFGRFGLSNMLSDSSYLRENKKFYPKLFRYRFDPNPNVQRSMNDIWKALVKDTNATIDENFDLIMDDLLLSIVHGKEWRAREASCAAISDLVQGREVEKFEKYLDEIWKVAFKVLDDVKESVRVAAMKLCRSLTNMLLRNLEVGDTTTKRATAMLRHAVPFLLQQMETGGAKEVQQYAIATLLEIVKKGPPRSLQAYAPLILETLVNSLSSLEHESINYLHLNAEKYGFTAEKLDSMRVSSIGASPVTEAIEKCLESLATDPPTTQNTNETIIQETQARPFDDAMKRLENSFKVTIGLPSKVGLGRVMVMLVVRHPSVFRPFADRFARLTRKSILDRNATISQSFTTSLAYLLRLTSEKEVRQTIAFAQKLYFESQEVSHRSVAGEILLAISKASNDLFMGFATSFLPFAFIGRNDIDQDAKERFDTAWKDNVGGSRAIHLYLKEISSLLTVHISSSLWPIRHACCFAVADLIATMETGPLYTREDAQLIWPLVEEALGGKTWEGKEKVVIVFPQFVRKSKAIWAEISPQMKKIAIREAKRQNKVYRPHAVRTLGEFARARLDLDIGQEALPFLMELLNECLSNSDDMDIDIPLASKAQSSGNLIDETLCSVVACIFASLRSWSSIAILEQALESIELLQHSQVSQPVELSLYEAVGHYMSDIIQSKGENDASEQNVDSNVDSNAEPLFTGGLNGSKFLHQLILAFFGGDRSSHAPKIESSENLRVGRLSLISKLVSQSTLTVPAREILQSDLVFWHSIERSRSIRSGIEQAMRTNEEFKVKLRPSS